MTTETLHEDQLRRLSHFSLPSTYKDNTELHMGNSFYVYLLFYTHFEIITTNTAFASTQATGCLTNEPWFDSQQG